MEKAVFINYFEKSFLKTAKPTPENHVILIYDGHSSHIDLKLVELAKNNNVTIILLPPHFSHLLQPLDLAVFKSIKTKWDEKLSAWTRKHQGQKLPNYEFTQVLCSIWIILDTQIIKNGFQKAGIYSLNNSVIDKSKFDPESNTRWKNSDPEIEPQENDFPNTKNINREFSSSIASTNHTSFEQLFLSSMKQVASQKQSKRKITNGETVITSEEAIKILRVKDNEKKKPKEKIKHVTEYPYAVSGTLDLI